MKIGIIGAGALGCYYGAQLARSGQAVHFIARGATLAALREKGITVIRDDATFTVTDFQATEQTSTVGPVDLLIVATKSYAFESIAPALRALKGPDTIVLPLQNGIDSAERLGALSDPAHILGGLTYLPAKTIEPGVVSQTGPEKPILLGPLNAIDNAAADTALAVFLQAGITAERPTDIRVALWLKYILVIGTMGVQAVTGRGFGATRADPDTRALYLACMREVTHVAQKAGGILPDRAHDLMMAEIDSYPAGIKASMLQDLELGRPLELDAMHGTVVRLGKKFGIPTPVNQFIYAALKLRASGWTSS